MIRSNPGAVEHKFDKENDYCWWTVNGTPRKCGKGDKIFFSNGKQIYGEGTIIRVEPGKIVFLPLKRVDRPQPKQPPTRGFAYVNWK